PGKNRSCPRPWSRTDPCRWFRPALRHSPPPRRLASPRAFSPRHRRACRRREGGARDALRGGGEPRHPGLIRENRAAAARGRWIDRENGHLVALAGEERARGIGGGGLAHGR